MVRILRTWKQGATIPAALVLATVLTAGAAQQAETQQYCWLNSDTESMQCFDSEAGLNAAMEQTGSAAVEPQSGSTPQLQSLSAEPEVQQQVVGRFYHDADHGGGYLLISRNGGCSTGMNSADLSAYPGWNDSVSSFVAGSGCRIGLYDDSDMTGSHYGDYRQSSYVGSMNDRASSAQFIAG